MKSPEPSGLASQAEVDRERVVLVHAARLPSTPVGAALEWVIARLLTGEATEDEIAGRFTPAFLERFSPSAIAAMMTGASGLLGTLATAEVKEFGPHRAQVTMVGATSVRALMSATVESDPPHLLAGLGLAPAAAEAPVREVAQRAIVLNGASSSGKTSIAAALQDRLEGVWLRISVDDFVRMLPARALAELPKVVRGGHGAIAALLGDGLRIIYDGPLGSDLMAHFDQAVAGHEVLRVGVRCDDAVLDKREAERGDRVPGQARLQNQSVHTGVRYDVEVDTSDSTVEACAEAIVAALG